MAAGTALTGKTGASISLEYTGYSDLIKAPKLILSRLTPISWTYGTGVNQINVLYQDQDSTDNTGKTLDLNGGGTLKDCFGNALTMENLKFLYVKNTSTTVILEIFGAGVNDLLILSGTTDPVHIPPGGEFYWSAPTAAGIDVSTNINLFIKCTTVASITYDIIAGGLD